MTREEAFEIIKGIVADRRKVTVEEADDILRKEIESLPQFKLSKSGNWYIHEVVKKYKYLVHEYLDEEKVKALNLTAEFSSDGMSLPEVVKYLTEETERITFEKADIHLFLPAILSRIAGDENKLAKINEFIRWRDVALRSKK